MRRMMLFVVVAMVDAATIATGALPTSAKQAKERGVGAGVCDVPGEYESIQSAVNALSCQTIQLVGSVIETVTIGRNITITGSNEDPPPIVGGAQGQTTITILPGNTVAFSNFHIEGGGSTSVEKGGGIYNQGTLVLTEMIVRNHTAANEGGGIYNAGTMTLDRGVSVNSNVAGKDGGGVYNQGTLYMCNATVTNNEAPPGTDNNLAGTPAQQCPTGPPGGPQKGENGVLLDHKGKELCLPQAALKAHLEHGDEVLDEEGCPDPAIRKGAHQG